MPDEEKTGVPPEQALAGDVADPKASGEAQEEGSESTAATQTASAPPKGDKDENMRRMREAMEELYRQNRELREALIPKAASPAEADPLAGLTDEDFASVKHLRGYTDRVVRQAVQQALKEHRGATAEERFKQVHPDYEQVVTKENLEEVFQEMPELKPTLQRMYALALKGEDVDPVALAYKVVKRFKGDQPDMAKQNAEKLAKNAQKPLSSNAIKSSALNEAHKFGSSLSKDDKARIFAETVAAAKQRN